MTSSLISRLHVSGAKLALWKKFRLFFLAGFVVVLLGAIKTIIHYCGLEFLDLNRLLTSGIGGAIFIIGFLLSSILQDYKESEKIPTDLRTSIEAIGLWETKHLTNVHAWVKRVKDSGKIKNFDEQVVKSAQAYGAFIKEKLNAAAQ